MSWFLVYSLLKLKNAIFVNFFGRNLQTFCAFGAPPAHCTSSFANLKAVAVPKSYLIPSKLPVLLLATAYDQFIPLLLRLGISLVRTQQIQAEIFEN